MPPKVKIVEVGPRDGLQNEPQILPAATKIRWVEQLAEAGLSAIEVTSFVSAKRVPQLADHAEVLSKIRRRAGVTYSVLVPNRQGFEAAAASGAKEIAIFAACSETFSQKNINRSIQQSLDEYASVAQAAQNIGIRVRGYASCVLGCPYEGEVDPAAVAKVTARLWEIGCREISLGDTIGVGTPKKTQAMIKAVAQGVPMAALAGHYHDTYGQALANIHASLELGMATFDSSAAGIGGCPFAPGAGGNVATEDVVLLMHGLGIETGVDLAKVIAAGQFIRAALGSAIPR